MNKIPINIWVSLLFIFVCVFCLGFTFGSMVHSVIKTEVVQEQLPINEIVVTEVQPTQIVEPTVTPVKTEKELINEYIKDICKQYQVDPKLIESIVYYESKYRPTARNGNCVGLMQVSTYWHAGRAKKLGVTNFYDPYSNILVGVDYISDLLEIHKDPKLVLMVYNMGGSAIAMYKKGEVSGYAKMVLKRTEELKQEVN